MKGCKGETAACPLEFESLKAFQPKLWPSKSLLPLEQRCSVCRRRDL